MRLSGVIAWTEKAEKCVRACERAKCGACAKSVLAKQMEACYGSDRSVILRSLPNFSQTFRSDLVIAKTTVATKAVPRTSPAELCAAHRHFPITWLRLQKYPRAQDLQHDMMIVWCLIARLIQSLEALTAAHLPKALVSRGLRAVPQ
jgi:hypothetical protein